MGRLNYVSVFIPSATVATAQLFDLIRRTNKAGTKKNLQWTNEDIQAFEYLKKRVDDSSHLSLYHPNADSLVVYIDSSRLGSGVRITQEYEGRVHILGFESRVFGACVKNAASVLHEALGVLLFAEQNVLVKNFAPSRITVVRDCSSLVAAVALKNILQADSTLYRMTARIRSCLPNATFKWLPGTDRRIEVCDYLSRHPELRDEEYENSRIEAKYSMGLTEEELDEERSFSLEEIFEIGERIGNRDDWTADNGFVKTFAYRRGSKNFREKFNIPHPEKEESKTADDDELGPLKENIVDPTVEELMIDVDSQKLQAELNQGFFDGIFKDLDYEALMGGEAGTFNLKRFWDKSVIEIIQQSDPDIKKKVDAFKRKGPIPKRTRLRHEFRNGVLYYREKDSNKKSERIVISRLWMYVFGTAIHLMSHNSADVMYRMAKKIFYCSGASSIMRTIQQSCVSCVISYTRSRNYFPVSGNLLRAVAPYEVAYIDFTKMDECRGSKTPQGPVKEYKNIFVLVDAFSYKISAIATEFDTQPIVMECIQQIFRERPYSLLISDGNQGLMREPLLRAWLRKVYDCDAKVLTPRSPQGNLCERAIRSLKTSIRKVGGRDARFGTWLEMLDLCTKQLNDCPRIYARHRRGLTEAEKLTFPAPFLATANEIHYGLSNNNRDLSGSELKRRGIIRSQEVINEIREEWRQSLDKYWELIETERKKREAEISHQIEVNDLVFLEYAKPKKHDMPYEPLLYIVVEVNNRVVLVKGLKDTKNTFRRVRTDQIKKLNLDLLTTKVPEHMLRRLFLVPSDKPINKMTIAEKAMQIGKRSRAVTKYQHRNRNSGQHIDVLKALMADEVDHEEESRPRNRVTFSQVGNFREEEDEEEEEDFEEDFETPPRSLSPMSEASQAYSEGGKTVADLDDILPIDSVSQFEGTTRSEDGSIGRKSLLSRTKRSISSASRRFLEPWADLYSQVSQKVSRITKSTRKS